ncbi:MAG TPA: lipid A biosynthesis acyltransferase [Gemmatimonadota bacterium]|nr:lipid A biosynthesis acyltransferase [Gemmatimonadota bacterium]
MRLKAALAGGLADALRGTPRALEGPLAAALGGLLYATHERSVALANLERAFPEWSVARRRRTALASYRHTARALLEVLHADRHSAEIEDRVEVAGMERLRDPVEAGRGALLVTGHYGNWEWLARRVAAEGLPFTALYKEPKDPGLGERLRAAREGSGVEYVPHDDARSALRRLRDGKVLGIVMDQEPKRAEDGAVAPLFGIPTLTFVAPFRLARITGADVVTAFCRRVSPGRYRAAFEPLSLSDDPDPERAAAADATAFNARLEAAVRAAPEQWTWTYQRWKRIERAG